MSAPTVLRLDAASLLRESHLNGLLHDLYRELRLRRRVIVLLTSRSGHEAERLLSTLDDAGIPAGWSEAAEVPLLTNSTGDDQRAACLFREVSVLVAQHAASNSVADDAAHWVPAQRLRCAASPLKIVLLGLGTVGLGVYHHLAHRPDLFEILRVVVRNPTKHTQDGVPVELLSTNVWDAINQPADLVIEAIGGLEPAADVVHAALIRSRFVVSANKLLIASRWLALRRFAEGSAPSLRYSAAVGGAVPVLETLASLRHRESIAAVRGIINGTCNFVLDELECGITLEDAVKEAQARGFAEADPTSDLSGADAAQKLSLLAQAAFGKTVPHSQIETTGILDLTAADIERARALNCSIRLIAECDFDGDQVRARVQPTLIAPRDFLHGTRAEENRVEILTASGRNVRLRGKGAGRWPTALAVLGDVYDIVRLRAAARRPASSIDQLAAHQTIVTGKRAEERVVAALRER
jgi:homoserine dehydrogenase